MTQIVILDNEAVQALADGSHRHHRRVVSMVQAVVRGKAKGTMGSVVVPTAVRVEAAIDRTSSTSALFMQFKVVDRPLDARLADVASSLRRDFGTSISVADAHVGAVVATSPAGSISIITSDPHDMRRIARSRRVEIVKL